LIFKELLIWTQAKIEYVDNYKNHLENDELFPGGTYETTGYKIICFFHV